MMPIDVKEDNRVWVSCDALRTGKIVQATVVVADDYSDAIKVAGGHKWYRFGTEWHMSAGAAWQQAEDQRLRRIASLQKSLRKLKALKIEIEEEKP